LTRRAGACYEAADFEREARIVSKPPETDRESTRATRFFSAAQYASLGLEMAVAILLGWWLGTKGDARFGTAPWLMLVGLLFGVAAGFRGLIRTAVQLQREHGDKSARDDANSPPAESNE